MFIQNNLVQHGFRNVQKRLIKSTGGSVANSADFSENGRFSIFLADEIFTKICKDFWPKQQIFSFDEK